MNNKVCEIDKLTLDTMVYFCFGITIDDDIDFILTCIIKKALSDATGQGAFNSKIKKEDEQLRIKAGDAKKKALKEMKEAIVDRYINGLRNDFGNWHEDTCRHIKECFSEVNREKELFSDGNAQKVVNMSLKYLDMLARIPDYYEDKGDATELLRAVRCEENSLHIPVDSYIIDELCKNDQTGIIELPQKKNDKKEAEWISGYVYKDKKSPHDYIEGWSNWNYEDEYKKVTSQIKNVVGENAIEWEMRHWIEQAKKRRKKEDETENK